MNGVRVRHNEKTTRVTVEQNGSALYALLDDSELDILIAKLIARRKIYVVSHGHYDETVATFTAKSAALKWVEEYGSTQFRIMEYEPGTQLFNFVYIHGLTEAQVEEINIIKSQKFVKTPLDLYARAIRRLLAMPGMTPAQLCARLGRDETWLASLLRNNPEPHMVEAEVHSDEEVDDRGKLAQSHPSEFHTGSEETRG